MRKEIIRINERIDGNGKGRSRKNQRIKKSKRNKKENMKKESKNFNRQKVICIL